MRDHRPDDRWLANMSGSSSATLLADMNAGTNFPPAMKQAVLGHLRHWGDRDKFPRFLPAGTIVAHKTGSTVP